MLTPFWSAGIGSWASYAGGVFTLLAMLTTYWSISLALSDIVGEQFRLNGKICWLLATVPSLALALGNSGGFLDFIQIAGGAIAIIVAVMVVPTYRRALKEIPGVTVYPSCTNFLLVQVDKKQEEIFEALRRKDILVKIYINSQDIPNGFRISVTTKDVDDVLISVFREALA